MSELRYRAVWLGVGYALVVLVIGLSLTPKAPDIGRLDDVKLGHLLAYFVLMSWFAQVYRSWRERIVVAAALTLMGIGLEYAQGMTTYRTFAYDDMRDDLLGVLAGLALAATPFATMLLRVERRLPRLQGRDD